MNPLLIIFLIVFASSFIYSAINPKDGVDTTQASPKIVTELGVVYVSMPKEYLAKAGYTELMQKGYRKEDNEEWITFLN